MCLCLNRKQTPVMSSAVASLDPRAPAFGELPADACETICAPRDASAPLVPARFLPVDFDSLPANECGSIAEDCAKMMSNPQAFAVLVGR
jgi:hypothetical protein